MQICKIDQAAHELCGLAEPVGEVAAQRGIERDAVALGGVEEHLGELGEEGRRIDELGHSSPLQARVRAAGPAGVKHARAVGGGDGEGLVLPFQADVASHLALDGAVDGLGHQGAENHLLDAM